MPDFDPASRLFPWILAFARMTLVQVFNQYRKPSPMGQVRGNRLCLIVKKRDKLAARQMKFETIYNYQNLNTLNLLSENILRSGWKPSFFKRRVFIDKQFFFAYGLFNV
jgi:hypothetical protein